jgi:hypothetical protein
MVRVPSTYNLKRKRFCIPLQSSDLNSSVSDIIQKAGQPQFPIPIYGHKFLDLTPFDTEPVPKPFETTLDTIEGELETNTINIDTFPDCIKLMLIEKNIKHKSRFILILYLRELGIPLSTTIKLLKQTLDISTFSHCIKEKQPYWVYKRTDLSFPSCQTLKKWGFCKSETCKGNNYE